MKKEIINRSTEKSSGRCPFVEASRDITLSLNLGYAFAQGAGGRW